jgi:hypothetical protein
MNWQVLTRKYSFKEWKYFLKCEVLNDNIPNNLTEYNKMTTDQKYIRICTSSSPVFIYNILGHKSVVLTAGKKLVNIFKSVVLTTVGYED